MKASELNSLENFIAGWYIDPELCDAIVQQAEKFHKDFDPEIDRGYTWVDLGEFNFILAEKYCSQLLEVTNQYKKLYPDCYEKMTPWGFTRPRLQRYEPGQYYKFKHCENDGHDSVLKRHLVYMTYLNDIKEGGGTHFPLQKLTTKPEKGLTIIWPATWTHQHMGEVTNTDVKYIITSGYNFMPC